MARPKRDAEALGAAYLTDDFWQRLCGNPNPTPRERFLYLTIDEFGRVGPGRFSHNKVVRDLGYTSAMINHYFGSRNGLISEAAFVVYEQYVSTMATHVAAADRNPTARLRAWMATQVAFARAYPGWAVVHNYPGLALENPVEFEDKFRQRMTVGFEVNLGRLAQLILDVWSERVTPGEVTPETFDREGYLANTHLVELVASVAMSTLGASVWSAGEHAPSSNTAEANALREHVVAQHIENVISFVAASRP